MKITFPCTRCGKKLKARENAVGRTRKCPVCATRVTCPEPVYAAQVVEAEVVDAEVVEAELVAAPPAVDRPAVNPYADLDDGGTYDVVGSATGKDSLPEARRICPMCGEMILATAAKCRFCGEVFDDVLKKKSGKRSSRPGGGSVLTASRDLVGGILILIVGLGLTIFSQANAVEDSQGRGHYVIFTGLIFGGIAGIIRGIYNMARSG